MKYALEIADLNAWYGESHVLHGVSLKVGYGQVVTLLGRNGSGRTTTLRAILGLTSKRSGSVLVHGQEIINLPTYKIAHLGIGYCPEERGIFSSLTCEENLLLPPFVGGDSGSLMALPEVYEMFPNLYERRNSQGTKLSGGEQQMLAVARILRAGSKILLLDEISEGLAPVIVKALGQMLITLKEKGYTILVVEQNYHFIAPVADYFFIMNHGVIAEKFAASDLRDKQSRINDLLGV